jgi:hypothetical protein
MLFNQKEDDIQPDPLTPLPDGNSLIDEILQYPQPQWSQLDWSSLDHLLNDSPTNQANI